MSGDEMLRTQLRELLLDDVHLPPAEARELMFERTFASDPDAGADLLPPDGLLDPPPDDLGDSLDGNDFPDDGFPDGDVGEVGFDHGHSVDDGSVGADWSHDGHPEHDPGDPAAAGHDVSAEPGGHGTEGVPDLGDAGSTW